MIVSWEAVPPTAPGLLLIAVGVLFLVADLHVGGVQGVDLQPAVPPTGSVTDYPPLPVCSR